MGIRPVFHVSLLERALESAPMDRETSAEKDQEYEVEKIVDFQEINSKPHCFVKWEDCSDAKKPWEPKANLMKNCSDFVQASHCQNPTAGRTTNRKEAHSPDPASRQERQEELQQVRRILMALKHPRPPTPHPLVVPALQVPGSREVHGEPSLSPTSPTSRAEAVTVPGAQARPPEPLSTGEVSDEAQTSGGPIFSPELSALYEGSTTDEDTDEDTDDEWATGLIEEYRRQAWRHAQSLSVTTRSHLQPLEIRSEHRPEEASTTHLNFERLQEPQGLGITRPRETCDASFLRRTVEVAGLRGMVIGKRKHWNPIDRDFSSVTRHIGHCRPGSTLDRSGSYETADVSLNTPLRPLCVRTTPEVISPAHKSPTLSSNHHPDSTMRPILNMQRSNSVPILGFVNVSVQEAGAIFSAAERAPARTRRPILEFDPGPSVLKQAGDQNSPSPVDLKHYAVPHRLSHLENQLPTNSTSSSLIAEPPPSSIETSLEELAPIEDSTPSSSICSSPLQIAMPSPKSPKRLVPNQILKAYTDGLFLFTKSRFNNTVPSLQMPVDASLLVPHIKVTEPTIVIPDLEISESPENRCTFRSSFHSRFSDWTATDTSSIAEFPGAGPLHFDSSRNSGFCTPDMEASGLMSPDSFFAEVTSKVNQSARWTNTPNGTSCASSSTLECWSTQVPMSSLRDHGHEASPSMWKRSTRILPGLIARLRLWKGRLIPGLWVRRLRFSRVHTRRQRSQHGVVV